MGLELKQYMFTFEGGGWNTCWALTLRGARKLAVQQYADNPNLVVRVDSVHLATEKGLKQAMSNFY